MGGLGVFWTLIVGSGSMTLRDVCRNSSFEASLDHLPDPALWTPRREMRETGAMMAAIEGRYGLEVGGPTPHAAHLYDVVASMDNLAQFADEAHGRHDLVHGSPYAPNGDRIVGRTLVGDAANLTFAPRTFDLIFASHVLEHALDPLGMLLGWDAVLPVGGVLFLILPWKQRTFDHKRAPNTLDQLAQKHVRHASGDTEALMADFEQTIHAIDLALDWGFAPGSNATDLRDRTLGSPEGREMLHWHVFDFHLLQSLYECLNYRIIAMDLIEPFHEVIVGIKEAPGARR